MDDLRMDIFGDEMEVGAEVELISEGNMTGEIVGIGDIEQSLLPLPLALENEPNKTVPESIITSMDLNKNFVYDLDLSQGIYPEIWYCHLISCAGEKFYLARKIIGSRTYWGLFLLEETTSSNYMIQLEVKLQNGQTIILCQENVELLEPVELEDKNLDLGKFLGFSSDSEELSVTLKISTTDRKLNRTVSLLDEEDSGSEGSNSDHDETDDEFFLYSDLDMDSEIEDGDPNSSGYDSEGDPGMDE